MSTLTLDEAAAVLKTTPPDFLWPVRPGELAKALAPRKGLRPAKAPARELSLREVAWNVVRRAEVDQQKKATQLHHTAKRRATKLNRTPAWADLTAIRAVYAEARRLTHETGVPHHVDHQFPLRGRLVSGLHVHQNLQILPAVENGRKHNYFEPC